MQSIAIKIFVHDCQAGQSQWIRDGGRDQRPFQDLLQTQLTEIYWGQIVCLFTVYSVHCLGTITATIKLFGTTLVFPHPPNPFPILLPSLMLKLIICPSGLIWTS